MAKKKSKSKNNMTKMIIGIIVIALAVVTICTLFLSVINVTGKLGLFGIGKETTMAITGTDVLAAGFNSEANADFTNGTNLLIGLKSAEDTAFIANAFIWGYIVTVFVAAASLVFGVLSLLGMKFKLLNTILGVALVVMAIVTFVFAIVVAGQFSAEAGISGVISAGSKGSLAFGSFLLFATLIGGAVQVYGAKQK